MSTRFVQFLVYVIGGGCYGLAGVFISAQTGSGDPLIGNPMLLQMFAAVVVGGTVLGGGRGGPLGTVFGAYILMMVVNILLVLNVSAYYSTVAEGAILILAVLAGSLQPGLAAGAPDPPRRPAQLGASAGAAAQPARARRRASCGCPTSMQRRRTSAARRSRLPGAPRRDAALCAARLCLLRARRRRDAARRSATR